MKVLHVCETVVGGTGTYLNELIPLLNKEFSADSVHLVAPTEHLFQIPNVDKQGIVPFRRPSRWRGLPLLCYVFVKEMVEFKPTLIHAHSTFAGIIARLIAPFFHVPVIYCPHGWIVDQLLPPWALKTGAFFERMMSSWTARIIAVSNHEKLRGIDIGISDTKICVIPSGISVEPPKFDAVSWEDSRLKVLFVGRLDRQKGIDILIKAIADMQEKTSLRVIGDVVVDGKNTPLLTYPHIEFLGWQSVNSVLGHMAACDVIVIPSRAEAFGFVAVEAMRLGKPVIASAAGGLKELVVSGQTGFLFEREDSNALAATLVTALHTDLPSMGKSGRALFLQKFTSEHMAQAIIELYRQMERQAHQ